MMEDNMKKHLLFITAAAFVCISCAASIGPHGANISIAPPLPVTVELYDPYYSQAGYYYYYNSNIWYYSQSKSGPWIDLPRDRYPREVRYRGKDQDKGWGRERGIGGRDTKYDRGKRNDKEWSPR